MGIQSTISALVNIAQVALPYPPEETSIALRSALATIPEGGGNYPTDAQASTLLQGVILRLQKLNGVR